MKELHELEFPNDIHYSKEHEWARQEGDLVVVGITDYAQDQLGDIVFVELPEVGTTLKAGDEFGTLESVKAVSELYLPVSGEIVARNDSLEEAPEEVNTDPYGSWIVKVSCRGDDDLASLLTSEEYRALLE